MTIQEAKKLYPKFYENPRKWVGYISVQYDGSYNDEPSKSFLTDEYFALIQSRGDIEDYIPLFKSQDEEVFTDYLEGAVSYALDNLPIRFDDKNDEYFILYSYGNEIRIMIEDISRVKCEWALDFSTSAYVDYLRSEQFYL